MNLTVLSVAFPLAAVGPDAVGGAEQVLSMIDAGLLDAGHRSIVVAAAGSSVSGILLPTHETRGQIRDLDYAWAWESTRRAIAEAIDRWPVDVVHLHGFDFHQYLPAAELPVAVTLHLPLAWYPREALVPHRPRTYLQCVSHSQRSLAPPGARVDGVIPNGVRPPRRVPAVRDRRCAVSLGRICPEKGFDAALAAARRAGVPWLLAGRVFEYETHREYFRREIVPRLDGHRRFIGAVDRDAKHALLATARCLLVPSRVPETSSLVAMESLACGTPVIAFPVGALPEVVEHGRTGFLVNDDAEMADAIEAAAEIDPEVCRATALERFSERRMVDQYLALYASLARDGRAPRADVA